MDNLTHTLIGVGLARAGLAQRYGRGTTLILAVASNLPDIDVACLAGGPLAFLWRRTVTHSVVGTLVLSVIAALLFKRFFSDLSWSVVVSLTAIGVGGHVFADLWNSYGVVLFWPFSWQRIDLDWVFIIDLVIWGILGLSLAASWAAKSYEAVIWRAGLVILSVYIAVCAAARGASAKLLRAEASKSGENEAVLFLYPEPFGPQRFRGVVRQDNHYTVYDIRPLAGAIQFQRRLDLAEQTPVVAAARKTRSGQRLDRFFSTQVWRQAPDGQAAVVYGLGFRSKVLKNRSVFVFRVMPDGQVSRQQLPPS